MAYRRWGSGDWYIFWHASTAIDKKDELLAVWHIGDGNYPKFTYREIKRFLKHPYEMEGKIAGYSRWCEPLLHESFRQFIENVDEHYKEKGKK